MDVWLFLFLGLTILTGFAGTMLNADGAFNYREYIGPWFRSLLIMQPKPELMLNIPMMFKVTCSHGWRFALSSRSAVWCIA